MDPLQPDTTNSNNLMVSNNTSGTEVDSGHSLSSLGPKRLSEDGKDLLNIFDMDDLDSPPKRPARVFKAKDAISGRAQKPKRGKPPTPDLTPTTSAIFRVGSYNQKKRHGNSQQEKSYYAAEANMLVVPSDDTPVLPSAAETADAGDPGKNSSTKGPRYWTPAEDTKLRVAVKTYGARNWRMISHASVLISCNKTSETLQENMPSSERPTRIHGVAQ